MGASLRVLDPAIDTSGEMGKVILTVLGMVSQMELTFIKERQRAGIDKAKAEGRYKGRPVTVDHRKVIEMVGRGVSTATLRRLPVAPERPSTRSLSSMAKTLPAESPHDPARREELEPRPG
jgi:DNA invertase Pin-like site-specific DNA recombinase